MEKNLMQRLSENFIAAQTSMDATVGDLRVRLRGLVARMEVVLNELEDSGVSADVSALAGMSDDSASVERLARRLGEQQVNVLTASQNALKASDPRGF